MPLFDFRCAECGHTFEALCRDSRASGLVCPECGAASPARLISSFAVSRRLTPCGTPGADAARTCGAEAVRGGCGGCCALK